ncbi:hypothetical protein [Parasphingopyxis marina]|uniref:Uncharacterized protein n=1 Tax=Parasphingopyxis marina TaxID=2761622 RepID=A0A842HYR0_9SPHN|nr:hypothetical protein [Parasphingopyxis marina]MBC2777060.1 hypothetical protein [Parasphingopyxis marina]
MTKETKKTEGKVTKSGAVELDENELGDVQGGIGYLKIGDIKGESLEFNANSIGERTLKIEDQAYKTALSSKTLKL